MLFLRSLLYFLGSFVSVIIVVILGFSFFYLPVKYRYALISNWAKFCIWWLKITCRLSFEVLGKNNIPNEPCVIISNHQSTWETLAFQTIFNHQTWVLKKELLWIPIFGWGLALLEPIVIDRGEKLKALKKVIKQGVNRLRRKINVIIFPEGTRRKYGHIGKYQSGGIAIAKKAQKAVLPVCHNAGKFWPKGSFIKYPGVIKVIIGKPQNIQKKSVVESIDEIQKWTVEQSKLCK